MIFDREPQSWKELQDLVKQLFDEIGCKTELEKEIKLARGTKKIDVYVEDVCSTPAMVYLCECKYWNKKIPKDVIHAFRTVVTDAGANMGFIIAKIGFQAGAEDACRNSNIKLLTWPEFQLFFKERWLNAMKKKIENFAQKTPILLEKYLQKYGATEEFYEIFFKITCFCGIAMTLEYDLTVFPKKVTDPFVNSKVKTTRSINSVREGYDILLKLSQEIEKSLR